MTVESFFELYAAIFGWQQYNQLWNILTGTGLAYLPFLIILLLNIIGPLTSQETRDAATTSVKRMEVDLFIAFSVVVLAAAPAIDLNASVIKYKKPCDTISGPVGTFSPGATGTTFDAVFSDVIATSAQVPVWWWGVMAISSGINREAIAHIGCPPDLSGFQMEIARIRIQDPQLLNEVNKFVRSCYRPARAKFEREQPNVTPILEEHGPDDLEWIRSHVLLETPGHYDNPHFRPREGIYGWPLDRSRDTEYPDPLPPDLDPTNIGRPLCNDWWTNGEQGLRGKLLAVIEPEVLGEGINLSSEFVIFGGSLTQEKVEDALLKSVVGTSLATAPSGSAFNSLAQRRGYLEPLTARRRPRPRSRKPLLRTDDVCGTRGASNLPGVDPLRPLCAPALCAPGHALQPPGPPAHLSCVIYSEVLELPLAPREVARGQFDQGAVSRDGLSWFKAHTQFFFSSNYLIGGDFALKHEILNFATGLMYIVLPMIFSFLMGVVGLGTAVGFAAIVAALQQPIQKAGRTAADAGRSIAQGAVRGRLGK